MGEEPEVGVGDALLQRDVRRPAHRVESRRTHELARRAVGLGAVVNDFPGEAHDAADEARELKDAEFVAGADIDVAGIGVILQQEDQRIGAIVRVEEFAQGRTCAPDGDRFRAGEFRFVRLAQQSGSTWLDVRSKLSP